jgi:hypothetical protein
MNKKVNKKAITHIEAILSILIFISGIVIVMMLVRPTFFSSEPTEIQINALEKEFKEHSKSEYNGVFYTKTIMDCYSGNVIVEEELPYYKVYIMEQEMADIVSECEFTEEHYTFPMKIDIYNYNLLDTFESSDFNITINGKTWGETAPRQVSIKAKEIEIKLLKNNVITTENVVLRVW